MSKLPILSITIAQETKKVKGFLGEKRMAKGTFRQKRDLGSHSYASHFAGERTK
jgi:hypothetical protein